MLSFRRGRSFYHIYLFNVFNDSTNFATSRLGHLHQFFTKDSWMGWSISYNSSQNTLGCQDMTPTTLMLELIPSCSKGVPPPNYTRSRDVIMLKSTFLWDFCTLDRHDPAAFPGWLCVGTPWRKNGGTPQLFVVSKTDCINTSWLLMKFLSFDSWGSLALSRNAHWFVGADTWCEEKDHN